MLFERLGVGKGSLIEFLAASHGRERYSRYGVASRSDYCFFFTRTAGSGGFSGGKFTLK
jgi:hypothetical protein